MSYRISLAAAVLLAGTPAFAADVPCATPQQRHQVAEFYRQLPSAPPLVAKRHLRVQEEAVSRALDGSYAVGVSADEFTNVWDSLAQWPRAFFILDQAGWVLKFASPVPALLGNKRTDEFTDVKAPGKDGLISHLRPELVTSIYAVDLPGGLGRDGKDRKGATRAVIFYDSSGESIIGAYASIAGETQSPDMIAAFESTRDAMRKLNRLCVAGEKSRGL